MQRSPPETHLHVPGAPAVLPVLVGSGRMEFRIPQVSVEEEGEFKEQRLKTPPTVPSLFKLLRNP